MKVLVIDDEEDTRNIAAMSLGLIGGLDVVQAESGPEGIFKAEKEEPDVILLDLIMPGMDGEQTFQRLRTNPKTIGIPVIFLTIKGKFPEFDKLKEEGALAVLPKPFDPALLCSQVREILAQGNLDRSIKTKTD
jgi:CheY-like chemotaxis protein